MENDRITSRGCAWKQYLKRCDRLAPPQKDVITSDCVCSTFLSMSSLSLSLCLSFECCGFGCLGTDRVRVGGDGVFYCGGGRHRAITHFSISPHLWWRTPSIMHGRRRRAGRGLTPRGLSDPSEKWKKKARTGLHAKHEQTFSLPIRREDCVTSERERKRERWEKKTIGGTPCQTTPRECRG